METFLALLIPALLGVLAVRLLMLPIQWCLKAAIHAFSGFLCLWILNISSAFTGILLPVNAVTVSVSGLLGIPGIALLVLLEII